MNLDISAERFYELCEVEGLSFAKVMLRRFIEENQPDEFVPGYTTRALCRLAGAALDGIPLEMIVKINYTDTTHGGELYYHMWHTEEITDV